MLHANTDRLLSLWAALHPDVWVTEDHQADGTFAYPDNATIDTDTREPVSCAQSCSKPNTELSSYQPCIRSPTRKILTGRRKTAPISSACITRTPNSTAST